MGVRFLSRIGGRVDYFGYRLDERELTVAAGRLLEEGSTAQYGVTVISSLKTHHGPSIYKIARTLSARTAPLIGLVFSRSVDGQVRKTFSQNGVTRFAVLASGLQLEIEKLMAEGVLTTPR